MLSDSLPAEKMGVYMGIFNFFIVIPQLLASAALGLLLRVLFDNHPADVLVLGGASLLVAGVCTLGVHACPTQIAAAAAPAHRAAPSR
jgi:maltose/moltooligosaccharide transporter